MQYCYTILKSIFNSLLIIFFSFLILCFIILYCLYEYYHIQYKIDVYNWILEKQMHIVSTYSNSKQKDIKMFKISELEKKYFDKMTKVLDLIMPEHNKQSTFQNCWFSLIEKNNVLMEDCFWYLWAKNPNSLNDIIY